MGRNKRTNRGYERRDEAEPKRPTSPSTAGRLVGRPNCRLLCEPLGAALTFLTIAGEVAGRGMLRVLEMWRETALVDMHV